MSGAGEQPDPTREARTLLASASALVRELIEEGVSEFPRLPATEAPARTRQAPAPEKRSTSPSDAQTSNRADAQTPRIEVAPVAPATKWTRSAEGERPTLDEVEAYLGDCTRCDLCQGRQSIVFGDGNPDADLMFIGEGPGEQEDLRGLPIVGRAREHLTHINEKSNRIPRTEV